MPAVHGMMRKNTLLPLRIECLSVYRLFRAFPFPYQLLLVLAAAAAVLFLFRIKFEVAWWSLLLSVLLFVVAGQSFCRIDGTKRVLLKTLDVTLFPLFLLKCLVLSLPFFVLHVYAGLMVLVAGSAAVWWLVQQKRNVGSLPSFYVSSSYQWLSMFRKGGIGVLLLGVFVFVAGVVYQNPNLVVFALGWQLILPCFQAYYSQNDPKAFVREYKGARLLVCKLQELLFNSLLPVVLPVCIACVFAGSHGAFYLRWVAFFVYVDVLMYYTYYFFYNRAVFLSLIFLAVAAFFSFQLFVMHPMGALIVFPLFIGLLHLLTTSRLKRVLYEPSTDD